MYWNILTFYIFFAETATFGKTCEAIERHSHYRYILIKTKLFNFTLRCLLERLGVYLDKGRRRLVILSFSTSYSWMAPWIYSVLPKSRHGWNHTGHLTDYCGCILFFTLFPGSSVSWWSVMLPCSGREVLKLGGCQATVSHADCDALTFGSSCSQNSQPVTSVVLELPRSRCFATVFKMVPVSSWSNEDCFV